MKQAVMYGGGNIGRGFIGALMSRSGYEVTFVDVAVPVVEELQSRRCYPLRIVSSEGNTDLTINNVTAVNGNDTPAVAQAIARCDIMATAVGARILKFIVPNIVAGLRQRWAEGGKPLNIIICENLNDANKIIEGMIKEQLTDAEKAKFDETVGLVEASIGRMVPVQTEEMKDGEPLRVCVESYGFLPVDGAAFKGEIPQIEGMVPFEPFDFFITWPTKKPIAFISPLRTSSAALAHSGIANTSSIIAPSASASFSCNRFISFAKTCGVFEVFLRSYISINTALAPVEESSFFSTISDNSSNSSAVANSKFLS